MRGLLSLRTEDVLRKRLQGEFSARGYVIRLVLPAVSLGFLGGCAGAPSLTVAGAYFPAWLACALIAILAAMAARGMMVATGLSRVIPFQLMVCTALGILVGLGVWYLWVVL